MRLLAITVLLLAAACEAPTAAAPVELTRPTQRWAGGRDCSASSPATALSPLLRATLPPPDDDFDGWLTETTRSLPGGYGGRYMQGGQSIALFRVPWQAGAAVPTLIEKGVLQAAPDVILEARWSHAQLYDWQAYLSMRTDHLGLPGSRDIDEVQNLLAYGFLTEEDRAQFEDAIADIGVPCYLVATEIVPPLVPR